MKVLLIGMAWVLGACFAQTTMTPEFTPTGIVGADTSVTIVASARDVKVFYASSPPGFSLRDNELTVEPGYRHRILGILKLQLGMAGVCSLTQKDALNSLQKVAYLHGANAVVYASTPLAREENQIACSNAVKESNFGTGWAVVLDAAEPRAPAAPVDPAAPAQPAAAPSPRRTDAGIDRRDRPPRSAAAIGAVRRRNRDGRELHEKSGIFGKIPLGPRALSPFVGPPSS
jgi:hypothetical protein